MTYLGDRFDAWRRARILSRYPIDSDLLATVLSELPVMRGLDAAEQMRLHALTALFVHGKQYFGTYGLEIDDRLRLVVAAQACLLIVNMDTGHEPDVYPGWTSVILYPGTFVARHDYRDEVGIVHERIMTLDGEASRRGPLVLSWEAAAPSTKSPAHGRNVVLHEFAHKLDFLDGTSNGHPPLHRGMSTAGWARVFASAYARLCKQVERGHRTPINPYAATNPAEFFAVTTEVFFEQPHHLQQIWPEVYDQLTQYYRQDPAARQDRADS